VAVHEAGDDSAPLQLYDLRLGADERLHVAVLTDGNYPTILDGDRLGRRLPLVDCYDLPAAENQIGIHSRITEDFV